MQAERWRQIEDLYHAALAQPVEKRAAFLAQACPDDPQLRGEVQSLLDQQADSFLESAPLSAVRALSAGAKLGNFEIVELLGRGGMGEVWRAHDARLKRDVAIKVLPAGLARDPDRIARFEREARAASALNHPNIVSVYDIGRDKGTYWIASELVRGDTLRRMIEAGPLPAARVIEIATQVAAGLAAAHAAGLVHRDLKPDNIMVTRDGHVKILDFGLAKQRRTPPGSTTADLTDEGVVLGTAGYMSPEQVRGEVVDHRSDLFSFGVVLYEMLCGKRAFAGDSSVEVMHAILKDEPPELPVSVPPALALIVRRCLEKEPDRRFQSAADLGFALESLSLFTPGPTPPEHRAWLKRSALQPSELPLRRRMLTVSAGLLALIAAAGLARFATHRWPAQRAEPKFRRLTANPPGNPVTGARISPDGKFLAYADQAGIRLQLIDTGETRTIPRPQGLGYEIAGWAPAAWFPDGTRLVAQGDSQTGEHSGIWVISIMGGAPRQIHDGGSAWSVSPDGSLIAFTPTSPTNEVWAMGASGEDPRRIFAADGGKYPLSVVWSPDGKRIAYEYFNSGPAGWEWRLETRDLKGGRPVLVVSDPRFSGRLAGGHCWLPGGRLIYSLGEAPPGQMDAADANLWEIQVDEASGKPAGKPTRITNWSEFLLQGPNATSDGGRLVFCRERHNVDVYVGDLEAGAARLKAPPRRLTLDERNSLVSSWTRDSKAVLFESDRSGVPAVYKQPLDQDSAEPLVVGQRVNSWPRLSADGAWVIYRSEAKSDPGGQSELRRVPVSGGPSQVVLRSQDDIRNYQCARAPATLCLVGEATKDDKQRVFTAFDPIQGRGREVIRIATDAGSRYSWDISPDGSQLVMLFPAGGNRVRLLPLGGGKPRDLIVKGWPVLRDDPYWGADGKGFYVAGPSAKGATLLYVDLKGNATAIWEQNHGSVTWAIPSPDGLHLAIGGQTVESNAWMLENF